MSICFFYRNFTKIIKSNIMTKNSQFHWITKIISEKKLFWISIAVVGYFCLLYLNACFIKSDLVFIGWF